MLLLLYAILLVVVVSLAFGVYTLASLLRDKVPYVSTPNWVIDYLSTNLPRGTRALVDIGCGDGRILCAVKRARPELTTIGYERNWWPYVLARWQAKGSGVEIRRSSFYDADSRSVDAVYCYLIASVMERTEKLLREQLPSGASVYSYGFKFPHWEPEIVIPNPKDASKSKLRMYRQLRTENPH